MLFLSDFEAASQGILEKVDQEAASEYGEKGAKNECKESWGRFIGSSQFDRLDKRLFCDRLAPS